MDVLATTERLTAFDPSRIPGHDWPPPYVGKQHVRRFRRNNRTNEPPRLHPIDIMVGQAWEDLNSLVASRRGLINFFGSPDDCSNIACLIAVMLSLTEQSTVAVDADYITNALRFNLNAGGTRVRQALVLPEGQLFETLDKTRSGLRVVSSDDRIIEAEKYRRVFDRLTRTFRFTIVNSRTGLNDSLRGVAESMGGLNVTVSDRTLTVMRDSTESFDLPKLTSFSDDVSTYRPELWLSALRLTIAVVRWLPKTSIIEPRR